MAVQLAGQRWPFVFVANCPRGASVSFPSQQGSTCPQALTPPPVGLSHQDRKRLVVLQQERRKALAAEAGPSLREDDGNVLTAEERAMASRAMGADPGDVAFGGEVNLESQVRAGAGEATRKKHDGSCRNVL
jgi:hypothetical protein